MVEFIDCVIYLIICVVELGGNGCVLGFEGYFERIWNWSLSWKGDGDGVVVCWKGLVVVFGGGWVCSFEKGVGVVEDIRIK